MSQTEKTETNPLPPTPTAHSGDPLAEYSALTTTAGVLDLNGRGRLFVTGADRIRFVQGQVTNDVERLKNGEGCYAALVTAKGKMVSDLNIFRFEDRLLLDFEPGLTERVIERLDKFIIADDVQVMNAASELGLISVQGPKSEEVIRSSELSLELPNESLRFASGAWPDIGEVTLIHNARTGSAGFDILLPPASVEKAVAKLTGATRSRPVGWQAFEIARIEAGLPRFGVDMDESNLAPETGIEARAISYSKGCYIGQEVIARIRTYGQVAKQLRRLRLEDNLRQLPNRGEKLFSAGKEVGYITSAVHSPRLGKNIALGYVSRGRWDVGNSLMMQTAGGESGVTIAALPFSD